MSELRLREKNVLVVGLGRSGIAAAKLLAREGARVTATDRRSAAELAAVVEELLHLGVRFELGGHDVGAFVGADLIVLSPGVPLASPALAAARAAGVPIWAEVELASRFVEEPLVGITGTNGKSTTTALLGHLLRRAGREVFVGGNLGTPLSERVLQGGPLDLSIVELSSFQLEAVERLRPHVAVVTNLSPDHLDRYEGQRAYYEAKRAIFRRQRPSDFAILNAADPEVLVLHEGALSIPLTFGGEAPRGSRGAWDDGTALRVSGLSDAEASRGPGPAPGHPRRGPAPIAAAGAEAGAAADLSPGQVDEERYEELAPALRGSHNRENAMAAILAARLCGIEAAQIQEGLETFGGLPHRLELVRTLGGVEWINDSKATNVDSALVALAALQGPLVWIAGGQGKGGSYAPLRPLLEGRVKAILTIGADGDAIAAALGDLAPTTSCGDLEAAVQAARALVREGEAVLLSPACASFDQFPNYEARGRRFRELVEALPSAEREDPP